MNSPEDQNKTTEQTQDKAPESSSPYSQAHDLHSYSPNMEDEKRLRSIRTKITIAYVAGPISLFVGGVLLGAIGLICGFTAYRSINRLQSKNTEVAAAALSMRKSAIRGILICGIALALNVVTIIALYPMVLEMINSGDINLLASNGAESSTSASSVWG